MWEPSIAAASTAQPVLADVNTTEHYATADDRLAGAIGYRQPRQSPDGQCPPEHQSRARSGGG
jgi:hypothetical protein